jgi:uncharacterized Fe-S cluster-containing radical SAM superfamily protein
MRDMNFTEPYMVAQSKLGGTWNEFVTPFTIQIGLCNLNCYYCFVDDNLRNMSTTHGKYYKINDIIDKFLEVMPNQRGILRISGGEPFLAPDFIMDLAYSIHQRRLEDQIYLWIDTNLLGYNYSEVVRHLNNMDIFFGICGCFKGFDEEDFVFNTGSPESRYFGQFAHAQRLIYTINEGKKGDVFFYVPEITNPKYKDGQYMNAIKLVRNFIDALITMVHPLAPLRTTVLTIKEYTTNEKRMKEKFSYTNGERFESGFTKRLWNQVLEDLFEEDILWLPQYQISLN